MEVVEKACCVVTVKTSDHHHHKHDDGAIISCSGVILNPQSGMVICNALPFSRFIDSDNNKQPLPSDHRFMLPHNVSEKLDIGVRFHEQQRHVDGNPCTASTLHQACTVSKSSTARLRQRETSAELVMLVNCPEFRKAFLALFKEADKWRFYGGEEEDEELARDCQFLGWFAVLRADLGADRVVVDGGASDTRPLPWTRSSSLQKGFTVVACGTPFGSLCQDIFMSSLSRGIVSNLAGEENALILTDARCLPGTEGGGLFLPRGGNRGGADLVGVIVSPLCWKANEWIGLTLVCSAQVIIRNIVCCMKTEDPQRDALTSVLHRGATGRYLSSSSSSITAPPPPPSCQAADTYPTVCLVDSGHFWGSGVLVAPRLALTCRHVVAGKSFVTLRFHRRDGFHNVAGDVLFSTSSSSPYDLAVVRLRASAPQAVIPQLATCFQPGEEVVVLGYGGLGQNSGPSLTSGILSKAVSWNQRPVMLQTTCAVQAGASGGAVVRKHSGELLGIVSSNTRDFAAAVTYPHLNFSIPGTVFHALLQHFERTGDVQVFGALDSPGEGVRKVWRLQAAQSKL